MKSLEWNTLCKQYTVHFTRIINLIRIQLLENLKLGEYKRTNEKEIDFAGYSLHMNSKHFERLQKTAGRQAATLISLDVMWVSLMMKRSCP